MHPNEDFHGWPSWSEDCTQWGFLCWKIWCFVSRYCYCEWIFIRNIRSTSQSWCCSVCATSFSNSLIIHQEKSKKITMVTVVWICDPNYHKILPTLALNFSKNYCSFEKAYQTLESVFHEISKHWEVGWKNLAALRFLILLFSVWTSDESYHLFVWYITYMYKTVSQPGLGFCSPAVTLFP